MKTESKLTDCRGCAETEKKIQCKEIAALEAERDEARRVREETLAMYARIEAERDKARAELAETVADIVVVEKERDALAARVKELESK